MTRSGERRTTSPAPRSHKGKAAAPPLGPTESRAGRAGSDDGRGLACRAAGDSCVAGPRTGAARLPAHPEASAPPRRAARRPRDRTSPRAPGSGRRAPTRGPPSERPRAPPAPPDRRPRGAEAPARLPSGVLRLLLIVPVDPARVLVVQLQALLAGRRLAVLRHRGGAGCGGGAGGRGRGAGAAAAPAAPPSAARRLLGARAPGARPAPPGSAPRAGGGARPVPRAPPREAGRRGAGSRAHPPPARAPAPPRLRTPSPADPRSGESSFPNHRPREFASVRVSERFSPWQRFSTQEEACQGQRFPRTVPTVPTTIT